MKKSETIKEVLHISNDEKNLNILQSRLNILHYIFSNVTLFSKFVYLCIGKNVLNENADSSLKKDV